MQRDIETMMRPRIEAIEGRAVPVRNLHVTLAFLGDVPDARLPSVKACAAAVGATHRFDLQFDRIEIWGRAHVLCLTTQCVPEPLLKLFERLRFNLLNEQFEVRHEEYRPHVTLARDVRRRTSEEPIEPIRWRVQDFVLVQSQRGAAGSEYAVLERWLLEEHAGRATGKEIGRMPR
jgi:RNA 2',3'-cyclic 3'-phosphodiesterase